MNPDVSPVASSPGTNPSLGSSDEAHCDDASARSRRRVDGGVGGTHPHDEQFPAPLIDIEKERELFVREFLQ